MDISSSTTSATITNSSTATATAEANQSSSAQKSQQSEKSFKDELQKASKETTEQNAQEQTAEMNADKTTDKKDGTKSDIAEDTTLYGQNIHNSNILLSGEINFTSLNNTQNLNTISDKLNSEINNLQQYVSKGTQNMSEHEFASDTVTTKVDYSIMQMNMDDAQFFTELVQNPDKTLQNVAMDLQSGIEQSVQKANKNVNVSATLMNALSEAVKTNQPFRIDFDKDISVIIKVDKSGALSAQFIPGDKAVEEYLKQNISTLKQRFDEQELSYSDLSYSQHKQQGNNRRNNKENEHE